MNKVIALPITDFKQSTELIGINGVFREIKTVYVVSINCLLVLVDDNYSQVEGYPNRAQLLTFKGWLKYSNLELYINPISGSLHTFRDIDPVCLN
ncbi:MAG: hypothetical protein FD166_2837 [Bacteroidetes bacterium]|nr:MAG: hypothetical protein FD166_2837 [Bacteroidota bacterium]